MPLPRRALRQQPTLTCSGSQCQRKAVEVEQAAPVWHDHRPVRRILPARRRLSRKFIEHRQHAAGAAVVPDISRCLPILPEGAVRPSSDCVGIIAMKRVAIDGRGLHRGALRRPVRRFGDETSEVRQAIAGGAHATFSSGNRTAQDEVIFGRTAEKAFDSRVARASAVWAASAEFRTGAQYGSFQSSRALGP
jgi:hypothetical protein